MGWFIGIFSKYIDDEMRHRIEVEACVDKQPCTIFHYDLVNIRRMIVLVCIKISGADGKIILSIVSNRKDGL